MALLLSILTWTAITLGILSWFGWARQRFQCDGLAIRFYRELRRRGQFQHPVVRT